MFSSHPAREYGTGGKIKGSTIFERKGLFYMADSALPQMLNLSETDPNVSQFTHIGKIKTDLEFNGIVKCSPSPHLKPAKIRLEFVGIGNIVFQVIFRKNVADIVH